MYRDDNATLAPTITQSPAALVYCLLAVLGFSLTLPAMRLASDELHPLILGPGRGVIAGLCAALWLRARRVPVPSTPQLRALGVVALCTVIGFPLLSALALERGSTTRAVLVIGLAPLATSVFAALRSGERPSRGFWLCALLGAGAVFYAGAREGDFAVSEADLLLLVGVAVLGVGYGEGARLTRELDGFAVICWALVLALPFTLACVTLGLGAGLPQPGLPALLGFGYVSVVSMLLGFCAWYRGLALGGVARGSQVQLLQPVLSLAWCALFLAEPLTPANLLTGAAVLTSAVGSRLLR